jgi:hypothetical protein
MTLVPEDVWKTDRTRWMKSKWKKDFKSKGKSKVVPVLFLTENDATKLYWGIEVHLNAFLTSALNEGEWSASHPGRFTPSERDPSTHWIRGCVAPRAGLDAVVKWKIPNPRRESNLRAPIVKPVASRYTDWLKIMK